MFQSWRVVAVTPAGRRRYLEILVQYLLRERPLIDEYQVWVNTDDAADRAYCEQLATTYPDFITLLYPDPQFKQAFTFCLDHFGVPPEHILSRSGVIGTFYEYCRDASTIYIRFDDDICFVSEDAVETLLAYRVAHPSFFGVYPNIVNQPTCTYLHQRFGFIGSEAGIATKSPFCEVGWKHPLMAEYVHERLLDRVANGQLDDMKFEQWIVSDYERLSINCVAWFGKDMAGDEPLRVPVDEELWLSNEVPERLQRPNAICGRAIVAHFAFYTQRPYLESKTALLEKYRVLAGLPAKTSGVARRMIA